MVALASLAYDTKANSSNPNYTSSNIIFHKKRHAWHTDLFLLVHVSTSPECDH